MVTIRAARADELERVSELEDLAGERYADAGLPADLDGLPHDVIVRAQVEDLLWFATVDDVPVGFALCWLRPGALHLRELDVHPAHMRQGIGRHLVEHVVDQAQQRQLGSVTLTTFRDVPWNAPLYARWNFAEQVFGELPSWLQKIRKEEDSSELGRWPRVAMLRRVV